MVIRTYAHIVIGWWMVGNGFYRAGYSGWTSWPLNTMASGFLEASKTTLSATQCHIPKDVNYKLCFALQAHPTSVTTCTSCLGRGLSGTGG